MNKFKVGDRVKVVAIKSGAHRRTLYKKGIIIEDNHGSLEVVFQDEVCSWYYGSEELVKVDDKLEKAIKQAIKQAIIEEIRQHINYLEDRIRRIS